MFRKPFHKLLAPLLGAVSLGMSHAAEIDVQEAFASIGPEVQAVTLDSGKTIGVADTGPEDGRPVLFIGGSGTSAYAVALTEFLRSLRDQLGLRFVAVERDGFGLTPLTPGWGYDDYAAEAAEVLDKLGIAEVSVLAISGGGPYAAAFAAAHPDRVRSLHLLAAFSQYDPQNPDTSGLCGMTAEKRKETADFYAANPVEWWDLGENPATARIPGWMTAAQNDGARTFTMRGQAGDSAALVAEFERFCSAPVAAGEAVKAPVYIYEGAEDTTVKSVHGDFWAGHYPNVVRRRTYPDVGHTVQYRHWDQVLLDLAGRDGQAIICQDGTSQLVDEAVVEEHLAAGATRGICAWQ